MYAVIVNPVSGNGRGKRELPRVQALLREEGILFRTFEAVENGQARAFAQQAARENMAGVIAVGGDGTLFEIVNGIAGSNLALLFACCGTGNDFVRVLRLARDPVEALRAQLHAPRTHIDLGRMNDLYFLNVSGTGFDVDVLIESEKYKKEHSGLGVYLRGVRDAIRRFRPMQVQLGFDGAEPEEARLTIISIANGRYIGGGMKCAPFAQVNDGLFDVIVTKPLRRFLIGVLMALYVPGLYVRIPLAVSRRCRSVRIISPGMTVNLDGELIPCDDASFEILPAALCVRVPGLPMREAANAL